MKYIFTYLLFSIVSFSFAQSPMLVNYQGLARDAAGNPIAGQTISLKFEVLQGSSSGSVVYSENQSIQTSNLGIFSTQIGKSASLGAVNWLSGSYYLQVSMDPLGGSALVALGTPQQLVSVPFAMHAASVPSTYTNNVLTIGSQTHAISSGTAITVSSSGTNVTVSSGPNYTISYTSPQLTINSNSIGIVGGNSVALPISLTPTLVQSGIATVTNGASSYTVGVPAPSFNIVNSILTQGSSTTLVTPTLGLSGGVLYSGVFSNSVTIPSAITVAGTGLASVTGGPNYLVNVAQPSLALSSNNLSISIVGSNSVALPAAITVAQAANNIITVANGPGAYTVGLANPVWTGTALILGSVTTTIAPTLNYNAGTLTVGAASNSVDISGAGPFKQAGTSVTLTTGTDNVAIGLNSASAKLDVYANVVSGSVIRANNASSTNTSAAVDVSSAGGKGLFVTNTSANGIAGDFSSTGGNAINAQNGSTFPTILAQNTNASGLAGQFLGGLSVTGSSSTSANFAFKAINSVSSNLFNVRNDGLVGIGTAAPIGFLHIDAQSQTSHGLVVDNARDQVGGGIPFLVNAVTNGQIYGSNTYGRIIRMNNLTQNVGYDMGIDATGGFFLTSLNNYSSPDIFISASNNVGIGTGAPVAKLDIQGSVKILNGTQADGKILASDVNGVTTWKSSPAAISFGNLNGNSATVGTSPTTLVTSSMVFTKQYAATEVRISLHSIMSAGTFTGSPAATNIYFEIYVDGAPGGVTSKHYIKTTGIEENVSLESYFTGLSVGSHTITIVSATNQGTSTLVYADPGGYGGKIIVKETF